MLEQPTHPRLDPVEHPLEPGRVSVIGVGHVAPRGAGGRVEGQPRAGRAGTARREAPRACQVAAVEGHGGVVGEEVAAVHLPRPVTAQVAPPAAGGGHRPVVRWRAAVEVVGARGGHPDGLAQPDLAGQAKEQATGHRRAADPSPPRVARGSAALALALAGLLGGCASPGLRPEASADPALAAIQEAFDRTVTAAHRDPTVQWQSGWLGNAMINLFGGARQGLCYEWRDLVYAGIRPTLEELGWEATGIVMSKGTYSEHSAVVVFDPRRVSPDEILSATPEQPVYVLDAWRRGRADIYPLQDWLRLPVIVRSPAELKPLKAPQAPAPGRPPGRHPRPPRTRPPPRRGAEWTAP